MAQGVMRGQEDIDFGSLACLKPWFRGIMDKLENDSRVGTATDYMACGSIIDSGASGLPTSP